MQTLDKSVFGALKTKWYLVTRTYSREYPGSKISKHHNFAEKLANAFDDFYRPKTSISFKATGIYPIDHGQITDEMLAPGNTYSEDIEYHEKDNASHDNQNNETEC